MDQRREQKLSLISEIATLYYEKHMTQDEIAKTLFVSRPSVSRLLKQAEEEKIVEITINYYLERNYYLENILKKRFDLKEARVLSIHPSSLDDSSDRISRVGRLAADYLKQRISPNMTLGLSWGRSVEAVVNALPGKQEGPIKVVQVMGATADEISSNSAQQLIRRVADTYSGQAYYLNAPLFVEDEYVCSTLRSNPSVVTTLLQASRADIILTGIGVQNKYSFTNVQEEHEQASWMDYLSKEMLQEVNDKHAVGSVAAQFFQRDGTPIDCQWVRACIGISLEGLKKIPEVIGVAVGQAKAEAARAAMLGKYINVLITDSNTASEILKLDAQNELESL